LLDLTKTEEELLSNIKKDDRYYINRAIKEWVEIRIGNTTEHIELLTKMHDEHSKKVWYHAFTNTFVQNLYKSFWDKITTISASYNWKIESILMTICFWKTCIYYIAASDIVSHKFSPNYLCQWEAIKQAKKSWAKIYNFWWVSPDDNPKHPISGVSKFKRRFWGYDYSLLHAQDLPLTWKYRFNYIIETIRRKKRGYYYKKAE
jgi:lipid II:glycine glycyltransferase (peptidoglycan interpeptide bridge formation enzyme)